MIVNERMLDEMLKYRISRVTEAKKPIYTPRLKVHKLFGEKKMLSLNLDIPISRDLTIKDRVDWNLEDQVDYENFVEELGEQFDLNDDEKDKLENEIAYQLVDHIEKTTIRTRMTKEQKLHHDRLKQDEKEKEAALNDAANRRKLGRGAELGIARRKCPFCAHINLRSDQSCKGCKLPMKLFKDDEVEVDKFKSYTLGFLARLANNSDFLRTFNLMPKLEPHDVSSMTVLRNKVSYELNSREDFDQKSKDEVIRIFELYQYKYITMGVYYSKDYPFLETEDDVAKEKIKVVSEKRGKPGRPRKDETVMKSLATAIQLPAEEEALPDEPVGVLSNITGPRPPEVAVKKRKRGRPRKNIKFRPLLSNRGIIYEEELEEDVNGQTYLGKRLASAADANPDSPRGGSEDDRSGPNEPDSEEEASEST